MKLDIFWLLLNLAVVAVGLSSEILPKYVVINAGAAGFMLCMICMKWIDGERPWRQV